MTSDVKKLKEEHMRKLEAEKTQSLFNNESRLEPVRQLLLEVVQRAVEMQTTQVLGGARAVKDPNSYGRDILLIEESMSVLPINEQCALMVRLQRNEAISKATHGQEENTYKSHWSGQLALLDLKNMQSTIGTQVLSGYEYKGKDISMGVHCTSHLVSFRSDSALSLPKTVDNGKSEELLEQPESRRNNVLHPVQASYMMQMLSQMYNSDIVAACVQYKEQLRSDPNKVMAISTMMQMGLEGQITLSDDKMLEMVKSVGVTPYIRPPEEKTTPSVGTLEVAKGLSTRRRLDLKKDEKPAVSSPVPSSPSVDLIKM